MSAGTGAGGNKSGGGAAAKLKQALSDVEDGIKGNATETLVCLDENGNILFNTSNNNTNEVTMSPSQARLAVGQIVTHNHPEGGCFSSYDLKTSAMLNVKQVRATTPDGRVFVLERKGDGSLGMQLANDYLSEKKRTAQQAAAPFKNDYYDGKITKAEFIRRAEKAHTPIMNKWLTDNASKYGYEFREEKIK